MPDRRRIHVGELGSALEQELTIYAGEVDDALREVTTRNMQDLVKKTKATAPKGRRKGRFKRSITADYTGTKGKGRKVSATWYVKAPDCRLTHLIVRGHELPQGGRSRGNPFLQNALDEVLPNYEREVEEVLRNG